MQKFNMIQAFAELAPDVDATFEHPRGQSEQARLIKMRVNAPQDVNLYVTPLDIVYLTEDVVDPETGEVTKVETGEKTATEAGERRFLAHVAAGFEQLEFFYLGSFGLSADGGSVWLDTYDNTAFSVGASDFTNYARVWEREERDPAILEIERAARHNGDILRKQAEADRAAYERHMAAMEERINALVAASQGNAGSGAQGGGSGAHVPSGAPALDPQVNSAPEGGGNGAPNESA